jgi:hypothetical protein
MQRVRAPRLFSLAVPENISGRTRSWPIRIPNEREFRAQKNRGPKPAI